MEDNYKPSKEFTDQAWSNMKALLDKEMPDKGAILLAPDEEKRKGFLLLLPLLLLLAIAALFFYYQSDRDFSNTELNNPNATSELALLPQVEKNKEEHNIILEKESATLAENEQDVDNSSKVSAVDNTKSAPLNKSAISNVDNKSQFSNTIINSEVLAIENQGINKTKQTPFIEKIENGNETKSLKPFVLDNFYEALKEVKEELPKEEVLEKKARKAIALLEPLRGKTVGLLSLTEENPKVDKFADIEKLKNRLPIYGFIGVRNYEFSNSLDLLTHVETIFRKSDKKLGFRTGINYAQRSTTYLTKVEAIAQTSFDSQIPEISQATEDETALLAEQFYAERAQLNSNPIKYHFLEIPVFLDYKFSEKWSLHGGLSGKALIYSSVQDFGLLNGIGFGKRDNNPLAEPIGNLFEVDRIVSFLTPRKFNFGVSAGFNYMATSRLGLHARYSQNLHDIYPELDGSQVSSSVELGLAWRFR